jgi:hypothetical protein
MRSWRQEWGLSLAAGTARVMMVVVDSIDGVVSGLEPA